MTTPEEERQEWLRQMEYLSRAAMEKTKAAVERQVDRANGKPLGKETIESEQQMRQGMKEIADAHPGQVGWFGGRPEEK